MSTRILICDDSALARKQMARALPGDWPVELRFAEHGQDALEQLRQAPADLLLLDLNMPVLDGFAVLEAIRRQDLPVLTLVVSGDIQPEARRRVKALGAMDFMAKPVDRDALARLLQLYGLYQPGAAPLPVPAPIAAGGPLQLHDFLQEIANVAMGRASDLLARLLDTFVHQPIPRVACIARSELSMAISAADGDCFSAVCQGFVGAGLSGEALLLFSDSGMEEMARLLHYEDTPSAPEVEVLMDMSSILFGAFLKGLGDQLDLQLGLGHPGVLGRHRPIATLLEHHSRQSEQLLCIEIPYVLEHHQIHCNLLVLLTEASVHRLEQRLAYLTE